MESCSGQLPDYAFSVGVVPVAEKTVLVTNKQELIFWEEYGLRLHIPSNSLPEPVNDFLLNMSVAVSSKTKKLPGDGILVSAVYLFCHNLGDRKLRQPITVEMQHYAATSAVKDLCFVRANDETPDQFEIIAGGRFDRTDGYGAIELRQFCSLAVYLQWYITSTIYTMKLCAALYFTDIQRGSFQFHLYIIPRSSPLLKVLIVSVQSPFMHADFYEWHFPQEIEADVKQQYNSVECGPVSQFKLEANTSTIHLDVPNEPICGWNMMLLNGEPVRIVPLIMLCIYLVLFRCAEKCM